jgi:hypothetical protein
MSERMPGDCERFDDRVDELVLGLVPEPERRDLLEHARTCAACRALLDGLHATADELLHLAPEVEPSPGFTERTAAAMTGAAAAPVAGAPRRSRWTRPLLAVAAALVLLAGGFLLGVAGGDRTGTETIATATIERADGARIGRFTLLDSDRTVALVEIDAPGDFDGRRRCVITLADGSQLDVGGWTAAEIASGAWSVAVDPLPGDPVRMDVLDEQGDVLATATL